MKYLFVLLFFVFFTSCNKKEVKEVVPEIIEPVQEVIPEVVVAPELIFTVQIAAFKKWNQDLANLANIQTYNENSLIKYRFGAFETYQEAKNYREDLLNTYKGAFVQALKNGIPIHIKEALNN